MKILFILSLLASYSASSPPKEIDEAAICLDLTSPRATASVSGLLTMRIFAGPPNYESIAGGDAEERTYILELPARLCANDGEFIENSTKFDRVQIGTSDPALIRVLNASIGSQVTVHGEAFGAHTGHHHAPLVILADQVTVR